MSSTWNRRFDSGATATVDRCHDQPRPLRPAVGGRQRSQRPGIERAGASDLVRHQRAERRRDAMLKNIRGGDAVPLELILRQIDAAAPRVFADIADDIGQLEGDTEVACVFARRGFSVAENLRGHETDDSGNAMAVALERREIEITIAVEVHGHAVDHGLKVLLRRFNARPPARAPARRMPRAPPNTAAISLRHTRLSRATRGGNLVDDVVDFAQKLQRGDRAPALRRKKAEL